MKKLSFLVLLLLAATSVALATDAGGQSCWIKAADGVGEKVWLLCAESRLFVTEDFGTTWVARPLPETPDLRTVKFLDDRRGYVAGDEGTLLSTTDGGYHWQTVTVPTKENLTSIQWQGESGWIAGFGGVMVHTGDGGRTWSLQTTHVTQPLESLYFVDQNHGWAVGWVGSIVRTTDGGHNWESIDAPEGMIWSLNSVYFRDPMNGWAVGFSGSILRSRDGGATWQVQESPSENSLASVMFDRGGKGWIAADTDILSSDDGGATWQTSVPTEDRLFLTWLVRTSDSTWVIGQYGVLKRSPDNVAWRQLDGPATLDVAPSPYGDAAPATSVLAGTP